MAFELLGRKLGMTHIYNDDGDRIPVTVLAVGPCTVVQKKTPERDGYSAVQLGFEERKEKHTTRPLRGHFAKAAVSAKRHLFEARIAAEEVAALEVGQQVTLAERFAEVKRVDVTGTSKGRGFTGVVKRWGFEGPKMTHGTHEYFRHGGSMAAGTFPGRLFPGKRMAGQYGNERVTTVGLRVERLDAEQNLLYVRGAVPGATKGLIRVRASARR
jgi:large subunit ribosomal protein L3